MYVHNCVYKGSCVYMCVLCVNSVHLRELSFVLASGVAFGADSLVLGNSPQRALYLCLYKANVYLRISKKAMQLTLYPYTVAID